MIQIATTLLFSQVLAGTTASIGLSMRKPKESDWPKVTDLQESVSYEANTNYQPCSCDLTHLTCDLFCCCDTECAFVSIPLRAFMLCCRTHEWLGSTKAPARTWRTLPSMGSRCRGASIRDKRSEITTK